MKFKIPCEWRLKTIEEVEARDLMAAQDKVAILRRPKSMVGAKIEPVIGVVDFQELERMYPTPEPPNPMIGWECIRGPGSYEGGMWEKKVCGCTVIVSGDTGPIEVGMGWTTYHWRVSKDGEDNDLSSKIAYNQIEMARDAALVAAKKWGEV
jgi:hypothetical protein